MDKVGRFVDGRGYYVEALNKFKELNDKERIAIVHSLLGETYESQGAWEDAIMEYKSSSSIFKKIGDQERKHRIDKLVDNIQTKRSKTKTTRNEKIIAILYLLSLIIAEVCVTYVNKEVGLGIEMLILFALLLNSSFNVSYNYAVMLRSMMVLPLIRIIGLSIPLMQIPTIILVPYNCGTIVCSCIYNYEITGTYKETCGSCLGK